MGCCWLDVFELILSVFVSTISTRKFSIGLLMSRQLELDPNQYLKFKDQFKTATGEARAKVSFRNFDTLWFNTGTLCNLACKNCYIESTPLNDNLVYITVQEVVNYLDELRDLQTEDPQIAFTGGEPFMNPDFLEILDECLSRHLRVLVLTNAMKPMQHKKLDLLRLKDRHSDEELVLRVSIDHYEPTVHESERGANSWSPMIDGINWLRDNNFMIKIAGRRLVHESLEESKIGYGRLFDNLGLILDPNDADDLVIFPEMNLLLDVPEITEQCWDILSVSPNSQMCANSRMIVKRKGAPNPTVVSCTLLPYDSKFELGASLEGSLGETYLNHPHCAQFCVLGGASCSNGSK